MSAGSQLLQKGRSLLLTVRSFYQQPVFVAYGKLAWSFLLTVNLLLTDDIRFGFLLTGKI